MFGVYEFEIFQEDGWYLAFPYDFDGGTQGATLDEVCRMAADWLKVTLEDLAIKGEEPPVATFGNEPRHGGRNLLVGVEVSRETVRKVPASEAARRLGVSPSRVTQMLAAGRLEGWREGRRTWVTLDSVEARLAEHPSAGRPRKGEPVATV